MLGRNGHGTAFTIVDCVAAVRAAPPGAAAELVSPNSIALAAQLNDAGRLLAQSIREIVSAARERVRGLGERMAPGGWRGSVETNREQLERLHEALSAIGSREILRHRENLAAVGRRLDLLSPLATLQRGYAIAEREDGRIVARATEVEKGDALAVRFQDGRIHVRVNSGGEAT